MVGSDGVDVEMIKAELEAATPLTVSALTEPGSALARVRRWHPAHAPLSDWSTSALAYAQNHPAPEQRTRSCRFTISLKGPAANNGLTAPRRTADFYTAVGDAEFWADDTDPGRRPFLVALGVLMVFVFGVAALTHLAGALSVHRSTTGPASEEVSWFRPGWRRHRRSRQPLRRSPRLPRRRRACPGRSAPAPVAHSAGHTGAISYRYPGPARWGRRHVGPRPLAPGPPPGPPGLGPMPGIPHGPGPGLPGIPHGGGPGLPHLPGLGGFHL